MQPEQQALVAEMFASLKKRFGPPDDASGTESYSPKFFKILEGVPRYVCGDCGHLTSTCPVHMNEQTETSCIGKHWRELPPPTRLNMAIQKWQKQESIQDCNRRVHRAWAYGALPIAHSRSA